MVGEVRHKGVLILLLRGVLGGTVGSGIVAAVEVCLIRPIGWDNWLGYFLLIFILGLPFAVIAGAILAIAVWLLRERSGIHFGFWARAACGTAIGMLMIRLWWVTISNPYKQTYEQSSWLRDSLGLILLGVAFGGIPGILIGSRQKEPNQKVSIVNNEGSSGVRCFPKPEHLDRVSVDDR